MTKRVVFIGQETAGIRVLQKLLDMSEYIFTKGILVKERAFDFDVVGVFTHEFSDKIADNVNFVTELSYHYNVPSCFIVVDEGELGEYTEKIRALKPDLILVVSWSEIIPKAILESPKLGTVGIHYSMLPERRGGAPVAWAIIDGLKMSGITLFYYSDKVDAGDIIAQKEFGIGDDNTSEDVLAKINYLCVEIVKENLPKILDGTAPRIKQDESKATYTKRRKPEDSEIEWSMPIPQLYNFIRALHSPYPNAFFYTAHSEDEPQRKVYIHEAELKDGKIKFEGTIEDVK